MSNLTETRAMPDNLLFGHTSPETAYVVDDYPYGYRLRTSIRYWVETTKHGDRFVSQTVNPKTDRWNKPKASTYVGVMVLFLDDEGHVSRVSVTENDSAEWIARFLETVGLDRLNDGQRRRIAQIIGYTRAMSKVTWTVTETTSWTPEQRADHDREQAVHQAMLARLISFETSRVPVTVPDGASSEMVTSVVAGVLRRQA
jgi:hypothetical protein